MSKTDDAEALETLEALAKAQSLIAELVNDLEAELKSRYVDSAGYIHPALQRHYNNDMTSVNRARAFLASL